MRLLFVGDVVSSAGCDFLAEKLYGIKKDYAIDITVVNGENSAVGNGITKQSCSALTNIGADVITTGNHAFKRRESLDMFDTVEHLLRPVNYSDEVIGKGVYTLDMGRCRVAVVNLMGVVYMSPLANPFESIDKALAEIDTKNIFVDFHAEATSEKRAMGHYLTGRVSAVLGTHTHVQTADEEVLGDTTGYISDVGMTGVLDSVLGIKKEIIISNMLTGYPQRYEYAEGDFTICGVVLTVDEKTGKCSSIERIRC